MFVTITVMQTKLLDSRNLRPLAVALGRTFSMQRLLDDTRLAAKLTFLGQIAGINSFDICLHNSSEVQELRPELMDSLPAVISGETPSALTDGSTTDTYPTTLCTSRAAQIKPKTQTYSSRGTTDIWFRYSIRLATP